MNPVQFWRKLSTQERIWFVAATAMTVLAISLLIGNALFFSTKTLPASGGTFQEGLLGQPHFINPALAPLNPVDDGLTKLIYPSLFKPDPVGKLQPYLAQKFQISDDLKTYEVSLKPEANWQDGEPITAQDVVFTIQTIQNPNVNSPLQEIWQGVEVEALDEKTVRFRLPEPYSFFLENLTVGILPKHKWQALPAEQFLLSEMNLKPLSGGPYQVEQIVTANDGTIRSVILSKNQQFWGQAPYLNKIIFRFYPALTALLSDLQRGKIDAAANLPPQFSRDIKRTSWLRLYSINQLLYQALFFNPKQQKILEQKSVRQALELALDKQKLIQTVWQEQAEPVNGPLPPGAPYRLDLGPAGYDPAKAKQLLQAAGAADLKLELTTIAIPVLENTAQFIKKAWEELGLQVTIRPVEPANFKQEVLDPRGYEVLLFGQALRYNPDLFSFWHSSQRAAPGLNLAGYNSQQADKILETLRQTNDPQLLQQNFEKLQRQIVNDIPAIFLLSPKMLYAVNTKLKGIQLKTLSQPSDRFWDLPNWYINTQRIYLR